MYPLTAGITQKQIRFLLSQVIGLAADVPEWVPDFILDDAQLMLLGRAIQTIHFPETFEDQKQSERRLKFDEIFILQLRAEAIRQTLKRAEAPVIPFQEAPIKEFVARLPFRLTKDQKIAAWEIFQDIAKREPMNRLLEGDVGSGKTVVAAMAAYGAKLAGYQSAILAPTEILARQHFETASAL